tara:strand:+ start:3046 stop:4251 length:1206 start_codon:yes stop_codon:yes gene_type:complete
MRPLLFLTTVLLLNCASKNEPNSTTPDVHPNHLYEGSPKELIQKFQTLPQGLGCYEKLIPLQIEIAEKVEAFEKHLAKSKSKKVDPQTFNENVEGIEKVGTLELIKTKFPKVTQTTWKTSFYGWKEIIDLYKKSKETSFDEQAPWVLITLSVRGILIDDLRRLSGETDYSIQRQTLMALPEMNHKMVNCITNENCNQIDWDPKEVSLLRSESNYQSEIEEILRHPADKNALVKLQSKFNQNLERVRFRQESGVKRIDENTLEVSLYSEIFGNDRDKAEQLLTHRWKSSELNVQINWLTSPVNTLFQIVKDNLLGGRAHVTYNKYSDTDKKMVLSDLSTTNSLDHEFGHILGFPDIYVTSWDEKNCEYKTEVNLADMMSDHTTGDTLPYHWEKLQKNYPVAN